MSDTRLSSKFVFILHADVVGSTALVHQDEKLAHIRVQAAFSLFSDKIAEHGGVADEIRGDALVAEFEKASDAVSAALSFQIENSKRNSEISDEIKPELRIGIGMGEVIVADNTVTGAGVVLAQRLEQLAGPGEIVIQGAVQEAVPTRLPFQYTNMGEHEIKGFNAPIKVYGVSLIPGQTIPEPEPAGKSTGIRSASVRGRQWLTVAGLVVVVLSGVVLWTQVWKPKVDSIQTEGTAAPAMEKPTIAVLPFDNLSNDSEQEYFSDGISEDIITDLSQITNLNVIARNSSFAYKGSTITIKDIANELGVGFVLDGSVRKVNDRIRISAQLIDAINGHSLWADRYDRRLFDIFKVQDEIRNKIVSALSIRLMGKEAEHLSRRSTNSFEAYDLFLKGRRSYNEFTVEGFENAESLYRRAIELDREFARAYGALGITLCRQVQIDSTITNREARLDEALDAVETAVSMEPTSPQVQWALGFVHMIREEYRQAAQAVEKSVSLSPNYADGWGLLAFINNQLGRGDQSLRFIRKGMKLNPGYTWDYPYNEGYAYYNMGEYEKAVEPLLLALERNENAWNPRLYLAASYVRLGQLEDAEWEIAQVEVINPNLSLSRLDDLMPMAEGDHRNRFFEDLKTAGLAE